MKKKIITTLIFALTITLTACSAGQTEAPARAESPVSTQTENSSDSAGAKPTMLVKMVRVVRWMAVIVAMRVI